MDNNKVKEIAFRELLAFAFKTLLRAGEQANKHYKGDGGRDYGGGCQCIKCI